MGAKVYTIERHQILFEKTNALLTELGYSHIRTLLGDGHQGAERFAPFDRIIVTCGADKVPPLLLQQLKVGGIMVIPLGRGEVKTMVKIKKESDHKYVTTEHGYCTFVPFLKGVSQEKKHSIENKRVRL